MDKSSPPPGCNMARFLTFAVSLSLLWCQSFAVCVRFPVTVTRESRAPDGYSRPQLLANGKSPGPALIINTGDDVEVMKLGVMLHDLLLNPHQFLVKNEMDLPATIHFHGIEYVENITVEIDSGCMLTLPRQLNTPWSDGVAGLSQKPIEPNAEFLYKWTATEYGTYWYHAHYQGQLKDGLYGAIHIRPRDSEPRPFDAISSDAKDVGLMRAAEANPHLVTFADWQHVTSEENTKIQNETHIENYCAQSVLINGQGRVICLSEEEQQAAFAPPFKAIYNGTLEPNGCLPFGPISFPGTQLNLSSLPREKVVGCNATNSPEAEFEVNPAGGWASFNFINAGGTLGPVVSIDEHPMWIYAVDGRYISPIEVDGITILNGERYSVMVKLDKKPGEYKIRASNFGLNQLIGGVATMRYLTAIVPSVPSLPSVSVPSAPSIPSVPVISKFPGWSGSPFNQAKRASTPETEDSSSKPYFTYGGFPTSPEVRLLNQTMIKPFNNAPPARDADETYILHISRLMPPYLYTLKNETPYPSFPIEYAEKMPMLYYHDSVAADNKELVIKTRNGSWVDLVMVVDESGGPSHPMHKHSNKAYALGSGTGPWKWNNVAEAAAAQPQNFNFENPQYRDQFVTPAAVGTPSWTVVRYHVVNPGAFLFHCHLQGHLSGGMALALLDGIDKVPDIPAEYGANGNGLPTS